MSRWRQAAQDANAKPVLTMAGLKALAAAGAPARELTAFQRWRRSLRVIGMD